MPNPPSKLICLSLGMLCNLWIMPAYPQPLQTTSADYGRARLDDLLNEGLENIKTHGGPHVDPQDAQRQTYSILAIFAGPPCPHCPQQKPATEQEEVAISSTLRNEAEMGKPEAQFQFAVRYLEGKGMVRDVSQGLRWLQTAADNGATGAAFALAQMYDDGINVPIDHRRAAHLYEIVAGDQRYSSIARRRLGEMNEFGIGVPKNYAKAMALYQLDAAPVDLDRPPSPFRSSQWSEYAIGRLYAQGKGVPRDYAKAAKWFITAVDWGVGYGGMVPQAECALAIMYRTGLGVERDEERSVFFLKRNATSMRACSRLNAEIVVQRVSGLKDSTSWYQTRP